ncbi:MAG TPA: tyrosine-type recombinase/integrase, partial [Mucilaginibacter sp.]
QKRKDENTYVFDVLNGADKPSVIDTRRNFFGKRVNNGLKKIGKELKFAAPKLSQARHSMANRLVDAGVSALQIQEIMQHSSFSTTENYLIGLKQERINEALDHLGRKKLKAV